MVFSLLLLYTVNIPLIMPIIIMNKTVVWQNNATQSSQSTTREEVTTGHSTDIVQAHLDGHCWGAEQGKPIITFMPSGRLGNRLCEYAHLFIIHKTFNVSAAIHPQMLDSFQDMFSHLSLKPMKKRCLDELQKARTYYPRVWKSLKVTGIKKSLMFYGTPCKALYIWNNRKLWREELQLSQRMKDLSVVRVRKLISGWRRLHNTSSSATEQVTTVGVHVRRGDYARLLTNLKALHILPPSYYHDAFQYYRDRFGKVVFLVLTEPGQRSWCEHNLTRNNTDVIVVNDGGSANEDLSMLGTLRHIIYSHGTFGLWGIFLGHTQTVVYPNQTISETLGKFAHHKDFDKIRLSSSEIEFISIPVK
uniref:L-Fucosyltransferase n=1 Tax=Hirondellea gigas TaxID=1518452 RepID=A0A2P2I8R5_9CRUS